VSGGSGLYGRSAGVEYIRAGRPHGPLVLRQGAEIRPPDPAWLSWRAEAYEDLDLRRRFSDTRWPERAFGLTFTAIGVGMFLIAAMGDNPRQLSTLGTHVVPGGFVLFVGLQAVGIRPFELSTAVMRGRSVRIESAWSGQVFEPAADVAIVEIAAPGRHFAVRLVASSGRSRLLVLSARQFGEFVPRWVGRVPER
jgi:hypothetical protein